MSANSAETFSGVIVGVELLEAARLMGGPVYRGCTVTASGGSWELRFDSDAIPLVGASVEITVTAGSPR